MKKALMPSLYMADQPALALGETVHAALEGNTNFPTPSPTLATLQAALDSYSDSLAKAKYGSREDRAKKNADKKVLIGVLRGLCDYVNDTANGNEVMLASSGFPLSKDPQPVVLGTAQPKAESFAAGQMVSSTPAVTGAVAYYHRYSNDPAVSPWPGVLTTKASCIIYGLQSGQLYSLCIDSVGSNGQITTSEIITKRVA